MILAVEDLSIRLGQKQVLRDVSFSVRAGEYLSIVGPNGAGKTTLLKCLDRLLIGQSGAIALAGRPLARYPRRELARLVGYVPQGDTHSFPFTVHQFVLMGRYPYLSPFASIGPLDKQAVREVLTLTGTSEFADRRMNTLSGGERQKVLVAAALVQGARILLLDEPTTFLDYRRQAEVRSLLSRVNRESGVTIVSVTHDLNHAVLESDSIVALRDGCLAFSGPPAEIMRPEVLERIYDTRFLLVAHPRADMPIIAPAAPEGTP
ncbi:MAG: ABC transporter ATP-binding protein [Pirellulales bacterium]